MAGPQVGRRQPDDRGGLSTLVDHVHQVPAVAVGAVTMAVGTAGSFVLSRRRL